MLLLKLLLPWLSCVLASISLLAVASASEPGAPPARPNIVLVIGDDHGWPFYGFMDGALSLQTKDGPVAARSLAPTPHLDELAAAGVVFTHGYSTSALDVPSLQTLLSASGLHPVQWEDRRDRVKEVRPLGRFGRGSPSRYFRTVPRELRRHGYLSWQGGRLWEGNFVAAGFTHGMSGGEFGRSFGRRGWTAKYCGSTGDAKVPCPALEPWRMFLDEAGDRPFFAWVAPMLPHPPYDAPQEYRAPFEEIGLAEPEVNHLSNIRWFDEFLGELLGELDGRGLRDDTLIIYVSDNGLGADLPSLGGKGPAAGTLSDLGIRTPVIFSGLQGMTPAQHDDLILTSDIVATIFGYVAGARLPFDSVGADLRRRLEGGPPMSRSAIITHSGGDTVLDLPWRYVRRANGREELYQIREDPFESTDLAADQRERVRAMRQRADDHLGQLLRPLDGAEIVIRVADPFGLPAAGAQLEYGKGSTAQVVSADADGWVVLGPRIPDEAKIRPGLRMGEMFWDAKPKVPSISLTSGVWFPITGTYSDAPPGVPVGGRIVVRVVDAASGAPVANAHVRARARAPLVSLRNFTNADGYAWLAGLPVNQYRLTIKSPSYRHLEMADVAVSTADDVVTLSLEVQPRARNKTRATNRQAR